jgi:tetratricopeptide (TPR) repeat protein
MSADLLTTGWRFHQAGDLARAEESYRRLLQQEPGNAQAWYLLGALCQARGDLTAAAAHLEQALRLRPAFAEALNYRGIVCAQQGQLAEATTRFREAARLKPGDAEIQTNLGLSLLRQGQSAEAAALLQAVLRQRPDYARAQGHLREALAQQAFAEGVAHQEQGRLAEAAARLHQAVRLRPDFAAAYTHLGIVCRDLKRPREAEACSRAVVRLQPQDAEAHNNLGVDLLDQHRLEEARDCFQRAVQLNPDYAEAQSNLGATLCHLGQLDEAAVCLRAALRLRPDLAVAANNLGNVYRALGRFEEALAGYAEALRVQPDYADPHWNAALVWLQRGDFDRGWPEYEWRWRLREFTARAATQPRWDGSPLAGRIILLYAEQGLGDTLQFIRYARLVKEQGATVLVECQKPLRRLLARCPGIDRLIVPGEPLPPHDVCAPLLSLPYHFQTRVETIPAPVPYLEADPGLVEQWRRELAALPGFKIGIAWKGSAEGDRQQRSVPLAELAPLAALPGVQLVSLQKGPFSEQLAAVAGAWPVIDWSARLDETAGPFMDTAAVMKSLDLVVTSDTAIPHLAGALGVPVWVALAQVPHWSWLLEREDCPWYPTMRLFRQERRGEWGPVFQRIAEAVRQRMR